MNHELREIYPEVGDALLESLQRHSWYLHERLVVVSLADYRLPLEEKKSILTELLKHEVPGEFPSGKPLLPKIFPLSQLSDFVGKLSWILFTL